MLNICYIYKECWVTKYASQQFSASGGERRPQEADRGAEEEGQQPGLQDQGGPGAASGAVAGAASGAGVGTGTGAG